MNPLPIVEGLQVLDEFAGTVSVEAGEICGDGRGVQKGRGNRTRLLHNLGGFTGITLVGGKLAGKAENDFKTVLNELTNYLEGKFAFKPAADGLPRSLALREEMSSYSVV